ncbi:acVLRF1 family peptidyl-tRNA hydrolase [Micromonospora sp. NPDC049891]|uniref:acVLRF1 family peptidyl-tRNA hydrolase n=1 Tax=Micromonospora sp. NPDC049891 TaxID=3155655 RepID=UPI0033F6C71F
MSSRPAAGGGRWVEIDPDRAARWVAGFADRHGPPTASAQAYGLLLSAPDGATAELHAPPGAPVVPDLDAFVREVVAPRRIGLLLARKGAVAMGVAEGTQLSVHKVDTRYVQGRTAAGGWSQQRFARRRDNQTKAALADAADLAVRLLLPEVDRLDALVAGGDRRAVDTVLADRRLAPLAARRADRLLDVPEPRYAVLVAALAAARSVRILVREPQPEARR